MTCQLLRLRLFAIAAVAVAFLPAPAQSKMDIRGTAKEVRLVVENESTEAVLKALGQSFGLSFTSASPLDGSLTGAYAGPLNRVLARLLSDYDFVLSTQGGHLAVTVLRPRSVAAAPQVTKGKPVRTAEKVSGGAGRSQPSSPPTIAAQQAPKNANVKKGPAAENAAAHASHVPEPSVGRAAPLEPGPSTAPPPQPNQPQDGTWPSMTAPAGTMAALPVADPKALGGFAFPAPTMSDDPGPQPIPSAGR
jgi:hypothetical protein